MKKLLVGILTAACAVCAAFGFSACGKDGVNGVDGINGIDGNDGKDGTNGKDGKDGIGITQTEINSDGELIITLSDGTVKNLGTVKGTDGIDGNNGVGIKNTEINSDGELVITLSDSTVKNLGTVKGTDGIDGNNGVGIKNAEVNSDGELVITLSDGTVKNLGIVKGTDGIDGNNGVGIKNTEINSDGELVITLSDNSVKNLGKVVGADGKKGDDGLGIKDVKFDKDGNMTVIFTDDTEKNLGKIPYCKHSFPTEWETVLEATCTSIGYCTRECDVCGYVEYKFTEAKGHTWDDGVGFAGKILKTCTVCHATQIEELPPLVVDPLPDVTGKQLILPIADGEISGKFVAPYYDNTYDRWLSHAALDFKGDEGTNVVAALDGNVITIVSDHILGENYITLEHSNGTTTTYKYVVPASDLKVGDTVKQGDILGTVAAVGGVEQEQGTHLHFELRVDGQLVDPTEYFNPEDLKYTDDNK